MTRQSYEDSEIDPASIVYGSKFFLVTREVHFFAVWEVKPHPYEPDRRTVGAHGTCHFWGNYFDMSEAIEMAVTQTIDKRREENRTSVMRKVADWKSTDGVTYQAEG